MKNPNMKISNRLTDPFRYVAAGEALALLAFALFSLVVLAWFFVWNYRAYAVSCNLRGWRAAVSYIAVIAAVTAASQFVTL